MTAPVLAQPLLLQPARVEPSRQQVPVNSRSCYKLQRALLRRTLLPFKLEMNYELLVLVTAENEDEARRIANALVEARLAACVNIVGGIDSVYRWEGRVTTAREALLIIKTTDDRYEELEKRVIELHSYSTPEVIAIKLERGSSDYLSWLRNSVS